jgi:hypothetical protein
MSIPGNLHVYDTTPEITGEIVAYRKGELSFAELFDRLTAHDYSDPTHYGERHDLNSLEGVDHHEAGTTGELRQARAIGLLTENEYEAIVSGALRAHGA